MRKSIPWGTNHALSDVDSLSAFKMKPCSSTFSLSPSISSFRMLSASQPLQTSRMLLQAVKPLIAAFMLESECSWHGDVSGSHGTEPNLRISPKRGAPYLEFLLLAGGTARWRNGACCGEPGTEKWGNGNTGAGRWWAGLFSQLVLWPARLKVSAQTYPAIECSRLAR